MNDWTPTRKVTAGAAGGALATLIALYLPDFGIHVHPGAESAFGVLCTLAFAYIVKEDV